MVVAKGLQEGKIGRYWSRIPVTSSKDLMYSMLTVVNNTVLLLKRC